MLLTCALVLGLLATVPLSSGRGGPPRTLDARDLGAVGDGRTDDTDALTAALAGLRPGDVLVLPPGDYRHRDVLVVAVAGVTVRGEGATLTALDEERSALRIAADDVAVEGLTLGVAATTRRHTGADQHRLHVLDAHRVLLRGITVTGSAAAGIMVENSTGVTVDRPVVRDTRADGVHVTGTSARVRVLAPRVSGTGDDAVAVVSYDDAATPVTDVEVRSPVVDGTTHGRGLSVVGGRSVRFDDVTVRGTAGAGIYVAVEGDPYFTHDVDGVRVSGGTVTDANLDDRVDHGAVLVFSGRPGRSVSDVVLRDLRVSGTRADASRQVGLYRDDGGEIDGVELGGIVVDTDGGPTGLGTNLPADRYRIDGGTLAGP